MSGNPSDRDFNPDDASAEARVKGPSTPETQKIQREPRDLNQFKNWAVKLRYATHPEWEAWTEWSKQQPQDEVTGISMIHDADEGPGNPIPCFYGVYFSDPENPNSLRRVTVAEFFNHIGKSPSDYPAPTIAPDYVEHDFRAKEIEWEESQAAQKAATEAESEEKE